ncbi:STAS domain-containing protein [Persicobacter psychrovividus]|uniref:Anti-sigma factor antagonist n=1 Tax=Persicobacter psychrovividus TaxID=387638 RepID=A0ABM7VBW5_9BACT|nr:anti-sigma F factor antagonist [Persicobacter psychrovividus]
MKFNSKVKDGILTIQVDGDLIGQEAGLDLIEHINDHISSGITNSAMDISNLRYMNSSGIGVLITSLTKFRNAGGELVLIKPSESVKKLLIITKLNSIFTIVDTEEEAIMELKNK